VPLIELIEKDAKIEIETESDIEIEDMVRKFVFSHLKILHSELNIANENRHIIVRFMFELILYLGRNHKMMLLID